MSPFFLSPVLGATTYSELDIDNMGKMYESAPLIQPTSYDYFWDVEELRHQEDLHRVSHARYLYRHRRDSREAARIYKSFIVEQTQWMDEQERIKVMESRLLVRAYQQRASRWEEEWRMLEKGQTAESEPKMTDAAQPKLELQQSPKDISFKDDDEDDLPDLIMTPETISSLHLPGPHLSIPGPSKFVFSDINLHQFDGAQPSKSHDHAQARGSTRIPKPDAQPSGSQPNGIYSVSNVSKTQPAKILQSHPSFNSHEICRLPREPKNSHNWRLRSAPNERPTKGEITTGFSETESSLGSGLSSCDSSSVINFRPQDQQEQHRGSPLSAGEVLRVIDCRSWGNKNFLYHILWKPHNLGTPVELWVRALDFLRSGKKVVLEEYHLRHSLGPVCWPRDPRRQWRSSTSFGVQELKSALDQRKRVLLGRGVDELEASREMNEERWKMRDEWQRSGRGWGSALMIVQERKKTWSMADSDMRETQLNLAASVEDVPRPQEKFEKSSTGRIVVPQAVGTINLDMGQSTLKQNPSDSNLTNANLSSPSRKPDLPTPSLNCKTKTRFKRSEKVDEGLRNEFVVTSEDEREWREHFMPEPIESRLSKIKTHSGGLSRVKSTFHKLPRGVNLELVRAVTLPELHKRIANFQPLPKKSIQGTTKLPEPKSPKSTSSTLSEAQSHLKTQQKNLLSSMLSRGSSKRGFRRHPEPTHQSHDSDVQLAEGSQTIPPFETATEPFGDSENQRLENQLKQPTTTPQSLSYVSFDGASSSFKIPVKKSWVKTAWDRFSHFLASSSRVSSSKERKSRRTKAQTPTHAPQLPVRDIQVSSVLAIDAMRTNNRPSKAVAVNTEIAEVDNMILDKPQHNKAQLVQTQRVQWRKDPMYAAGPSALISTIVETSTSRTALWAASLSPMLRKSRSEEPRRVKWASLFTDGEDLIADMIFAPSRTDTETIPETAGFNQISLEITSGANVPSNQAHIMKKSLKRNKGKYKAKPEPHTPVSEQTRTHSQQQYLANREAEREARRNRNILEIKAKGRKIKEKADQRAEQFKRLDMLYSKACPLGKWSKRDQVELERLRAKLGLRGAKNSWKRNDLRKLGMAELQELRESLLPTARVASKQPKGQPPA